MVAADFFREFRQQMIRKKVKTAIHEDIMGGTKSIRNEVSFINEWHDGKRDALQRLFDLYYARLCNYSYRIVEDRCLSEDIVSASFDKIWRRRNHFDNLNSLLAYLYTITKNASLDQVALLKRRKTAHRQIAYLSDDHEDVIQNKMIRKEVLRTILAETETLPPKLKEVFGLIYLDGLSVYHTAEKLGVSLNTVKKQQSIALKKLRPVLQKKYSGLTCISTQSGKYEESAFEYNRHYDVVPKWNYAGGRKVFSSERDVFDFGKIYEQHEDLVGLGSAILI